MRRLAIALLALVGGCGGCGGAPLSPVERRAVRDGAVAFVASIPDTLAARGPRAWLALFEDGPEFFMLADGGMTFVNRDSAVAFLDRFAPTVLAMRLDFTDIRAEALGPGVASVAATYREEIAFRDASVRRYSGAMSGVARRSAAGWHLQHLHWSSPVAAP